MKCSSFGHIQYLLDVDERNTSHLNAQTINGIRSAVYSLKKKNPATLDEINIFTGFLWVECYTIEWENESQKFSKFKLYILDGRFTIEPEYITHNYQFICTTVETVHALSISFIWFMFTSRSIRSNCVISPIFFYFVIEVPYTNSIIFKCFCLRILDNIFVCIVLL